MQKLLILIIRGYRYFISPLMGPRCRFEPSCSCYAQTALERFGVWRGLYLAIRRLLRCHPFHAGGYDPVPESNEFNWYSNRQSQSCAVHFHDDTDHSSANKTL